VLGLTLVVTIGKYLLLAGLYAFVFVVFRGMMGQIAAESARATEGGRRGRRREVASRRAIMPQVTTRPARPPRAASPPAPEPALERAPQAAQQAPPAREASAPEAAPEPVAPAETPPAAPPAPAAPHLRVLESDDERLSAGDTLPLSAAVTIGRSDENSVRLSDRFVSSRHALICLRDGRRLLVDRGSTNGTFLNGERVEEEVELHDGDRIAMGNTVFEYHVG